MHTQDEIARLFNAANYVVTRVNHHKPVSVRIEGYLQVCDAARPSQLILVARFGAFNWSNSVNFPIDVLTSRISKLILHHNQGSLISRDLTSSDLGLPPGAVMVDDLIFSFASQSVINEDLTDEAITIMIGIQARLLKQKDVKQKRCIPGKTSYNPILRRLLSNHHRD